VVALSPWLPGAGTLSGNDNPVGATLVVAQGRHRGLPLQGRHRGLPLLSSNTLPPEVQT